MSSPVAILVMVDIETPTGAYTAITGDELQSLL